MSPFIQQFIIIVYRVPGPVMVTKMNKIDIPVFMEFIVEPERKTNQQTNQLKTNQQTNGSQIVMTAMKETSRVVMEGFLEEVMFGNEWESRR